MRLIDADELRKQWSADDACESDYTHLHFLESIDSAPTINQWIPVTERLPEEGGRVLATHLGGLDPNRQVIEHIYENGRFTCGWYMDMDITSPTFGERYMGDVIAWMPLPKAYEGSGTE